MRTVMKNWSLVRPPRGLTSTSCRARKRETWTRLAGHHMYGESTRNLRKFGSKVVTKYSLIYEGMKTSDSVRDVYPGPNLIDEVWAPRGSLSIISGNGGSVALLVQCHIRLN